MLLAWEILILNLFISFTEILSNYSWYYPAMSIYESRSEEKQTGGGRWSQRYLNLRVIIIASKECVLANNR